jgi:hypothetical protein
MIDYDDPERVARNQLAQTPGLVCQQAGSPVGSYTAITSGNPGSASRGHFSIRLPAIAAYLAKNSRSGPHESGGDRRRTHAKPQLHLNQCPFLHIQVNVASRHMQLSPISEMLHLYLESTKALKGSVKPPKES